MHFADAYKGPAGMGCPSSFSTTMSNEGTVALNNYLQAKGQLTSLSWVDVFTTAKSPGDQPMWTSTCKIAGTVVAVGTGTHKHIAKNAAAIKALQSLTKADDQG